MLLGVLGGLFPTLIKKNAEDAEDAEDCWAGNTLMHYCARRRDANGLPNYGKSLSFLTTANGSYLFVD
jgi:hypothetical protein